MTGGKAFTFFLILAMLAPLALLASVSLAERWAPTVHRWHEKHPRAINWGLALFFFAAAVSWLAKPAPHASIDPLDKVLHSTAGRLLTFAMCALNAVDYVRKARRSTSPAYSSAK